MCVPSLVRDYKLPPAVITQRLEAKRRKYFVSFGENFQVDALYINNATNFMGRQKFVIQGVNKFLLAQIHVLLI